MCCFWTSDIEREVPKTEVARGEVSREQSSAGSLPRSGGRGLGGRPVHRGVLYLDTCLDGRFWRCIEMTV